MINNKLINLIKASKCKYAYTLDNNTILGYSSNSIFKIIKVEGDEDISFKTGIDINEYRKLDKATPSEIDGIVWYSDNIKDNLTDIYGKINKIISNAQCEKSVKLEKALCPEFYDILNNFKSANGGKFVDILNDNNIIFIYPGIFKIKKNDILELNRYVADDNHKLYEFILKYKGYKIYTYLLAFNIS